MRIFSKKIGLVFAVAILLSGCAINHHYTPKPDTHKLDPITQEFTSSISLSLINDQEDETEHLYRKAGAHRYHVNYNKWTDVAIQVLSRELAARNATIDENADKSIKLAVVSVQLISHAWTVETLITLDAKLSDGYTSSYVGRNSVTGFAYSYTRQTDGAIMRAVAAMLNDPKIVEFVRG